MKETFEDRLTLYKENNAKHRQNWKKIHALQNYAKATEEIGIWEELELLIRFYLKGYLWQSQQQLLDDMLDHYQIDYTKWAVKDGWVKMQHFRGSMQKRGSQQLELWFEDLERKKVEAREKMPIYSKLERHKHIQMRFL